MREQEIINEKFLNLVNSIFNSYSFLASDKEELKNASYNLEFEMIGLYDSAKQFNDGEISIEQFKKVLIDIVTNETNQLIVVDEEGQEVSDELKALQNYLAISAYDKYVTENFATTLYGILAKARTFVYYKLSDGETLFVVQRGSMMPSSLTIFNQPTDDASAGSVE